MQLWPANINASWPDQAGEKTLTRIIREHKTTYTRLVLAMNLQTQGLLNEQPTSIITSQEMADAPKTGRKRDLLKRSVWRSL